MSKLQTIRSALENNPDIAILGYSDKKYSGDFSIGLDYLANYVKFLVKPRIDIGDIANIGAREELEAFFSRIREFMFGLVPGLKPDSVEKFNYELGSKGWFSRQYTLTRFGGLVFYENVGVQVSKLKLADEELLAWYGELPQAAQNASRRAMRRIDVGVCPSSDLESRAIHTFKHPILGGF